MRWVISILLVAVLPSFIPSCDSLPRDQAGTFDRIKTTREIRVGLIEQEPFVKTVNGEPAGVEVEIIKRFAAGIGAKPVWTHGGEERMMKSLERFELDMVAGGLTKATPWIKHVGITAAYREEQIFAVAPGENELVRRLDDFTHLHREEIEQLFADEGVSR